jgi:hypothetical protein
VTGEVLIADRGYAKAKELQACLGPSGSGARDFIVRVGWKALALRDREGNPFNPIAHLEKLPQGGRWPAGMGGADGDWLSPGLRGGRRRRQPAADPADCGTASARQGRSQPCETEAHGQQAPRRTRSAQSARSRLHGAW